MLVHKKVTKEEDTPYRFILASAPHLGRLAQLSLAASKLRWLLRTSNSARHLSQMPLDSQARQQGIKKQTI